MSIDCLTQTVSLRKGVVILNQPLTCSLHIFTGGKIKCGAPSTLYEHDLGLYTLKSGNKITTSPYLITEGSPCLGYYRFIGTYELAMSDQEVAVWPNLQNQVLNELLRIDVKEILGERGGQLLGQPLDQGMHNSIMENALMAFVGFRI
jgi:hypothetical protein